MAVYSARWFVSLRKGDCLWCKLLTKWRGDCEGKFFNFLLTSDLATSNQSPPSRIGSFRGELKFFTPSTFHPFHLHGNFSCRTLRKLRCIITLYVAVKFATRKYSYCDRDCLTKTKFRLNWSDLDLGDIKHGFVVFFAVWFSLLGMNRGWFPESPTCASYFWFWNGNEIRK